MTEQPSAEAMKLTSRYADGEVKKCASEIDTLIAQHVAAETVRWQTRDRQRLEQIARLQETVQSFQSARDERPAPERSTASLSAREWSAKHNPLTPPLTAPSPAPAAVVDYTEQALIVARDAIEGVPSHLLPYRINSEEIAQAIAPDIADALSAVASERDAALLARLEEPDVREAVKTALEQGRPHWITGVGPGGSGLGGMADAAIAGIIKGMLK